MESSRSEFLWLSMFFRRFYYLYGRYPMPIADLTTLVNATTQNLSQLKGLSIAYNLLGGAPSIAGYTALINANNASNFGAGPGPVFNDENVYINTLNALYQGNPDAKTAFDAIVSGGASLSDKLTLVYNKLVPADARTDAGLNFFKSQSAFYEARAAELGVAGSNGAALVAYASLAKIAVDNDIGGLGDSINDLVAAVLDGSAALPEDGAAFTPLETADGTAFDGDDVNPDAVTLTNGIDVVTGNEFSAPRGFTPGGTDQVNTLDNDDILTGTGANPTLNLTFVTDADTGLNNITPTLKGVETANVRFEGGIGSTQTLDLQDSAGMKNVNLSSIAEAQVVSVQNIAEAGTNNLSINNSQSPNSTINFRYIDSAVAGAADTANLLLNNAGTGFLNLQSMTGKEGIETLNLTSSGGANSVGQTTAQDLGTVNIAGDQSLLLGNSADTTNGAGGTVEATHYGNGFANVAGSLSKVDASGLKAGLEVNLGTEVVALKDGTSGVDVDFAFTGTGSDDTVRLLSGLNKGDAFDLGEGTDTVSLFQSAGAGSIKGTESVNILSGHDAGTGADTINFDTSIAPDLKDVFIRNEGQDLVAGNWVSKAEAMTVNLTKVSTEVAANLTVAHGTTGNNGLAGNLITVAPATDGASDTVGLKIVDGMNADPRFNVQLQAVAYENVTLTDSDTEDNTVQLGLAGNVLPHTGTLTVAGGQAGKFFNLDATANLLRKDASGAATDGVGVADVGAGGAERFSGAKIDATGTASDVFVRVSTLTDAKGVEQPGGGQTIQMGSGNDWVVFDELGDTTAGLTINDTVAGGAGNDTLAIDGNGVKVNISASEWTNVTGFENIHLVGNGVAGVNTDTVAGKGDAYGRNSYNLTLTNDLIAANGVGGVINIINDNDSANDVVGVADTAGTGTERGVTIDARTLSAQNSFTYNGEEGGSRTADRFILSDANVNGKAVIDGGAVLGGGNAAINTANTDVMEVRNSAVVTTGDLTGLKNIGTIEFTNDQAAPQTSVLQLDNASVDALVNSSRVAATGFEETLTVRAYDNPTVPAATTTLNVDASQVTNAALQVNIAGAGGADTIVGGAGNDAIDGGAGIDSIGLGSGGTDTVVFDAANATSADGDLITGFTAGAGAGFDIMQLDVSDVGAGIIAGLTANVVNVAGSANNSIIVDTASTDYANFAAAEAAVQAANAATTDYLLTFFNTTTNRLEVYADADSSAAGGEVLLATFDDVAVTGAANTFMNTLTAGNFDLV
jgi:hypothetical protein